MSRSAEEEYVEGVEDDVESKYETDHEEQLCPCDTASEENLIKWISKKITKDKKNDTKERYCSIPSKPVS